MTAQLVKMEAVRRVHEKIHAEALIQGYMAVLLQFIYRS